MSRFIVVPADLKDPDGYTHRFIALDVVDHIVLGPADGENGKVQFTFWFNGGGFITSGLLSLEQADRIGAKILGNSLVYPPPSNPENSPPYWNPPPTEL